MKFIFECKESDAPIILGMLLNEFGIKAEEFRARRSRFASPAGSGFGDNVWRINYAENIVEASFEKPCWKSKTLKSAGFKWIHEKGVWASENSQRSADILNLLKMVRVDDIPAS